MSDAGSYKSDAEDTMHSTSTPIRDMVGIILVCNIILPKPYFI